MGSVFTTFTKAITVLFERKLFLLKIHSVKYGLIFMKLPILSGITDMHALYLCLKSTGSALCILGKRLPMQDGAWEVLLK